MDKIELSVVVPLYNEQDCIAPLYTSLTKALTGTTLPYEIIFVDDGSSDGTFSCAKSYAENDSRLKVIRFRKNYGQTPAMKAGINFARGGIIITMDGDLQNDPADIPLLIKKIHEGYDLVCGWRIKRKDRFITRKLPSMIANWIISKVTGIPIKDNGCSLKAYRADMIKSLPFYSDMHRFIPAMMSISGSKFCQIGVRHHPRRYGTSKYGLSRVYKVLIDIVVIKTLMTFSKKPLTFFVPLSILSSIVGGILIILSILMGGVFDKIYDFSMASSGFLFLILSIFLVFIGLLCALSNHYSGFFHNRKYNVENIT